MCRKKRSSAHPTSGENRPQDDLRQIQSVAFREAVFEVVEIPHHRAFIETLSRETYSEIHTFGSGKLYIRQQTYRVFQRLPLVDRKRMGQTAFSMALKRSVSPRSFCR